MRIVLLFACNLIIQAAAFYCCLLLFPGASRTGFFVLGGFMALADLSLLLFGLSLRKSYLGSRDAVARHGAGRISAILDLLLLEGEMLGFLGQTVSGRLAERGQGGDMEQALADLREVGELAGKAKAALDGGKGRQDAFFSALARAEERFALIFPRLEASQRKTVLLLKEVLDEFRGSRESMYRYLFFLTETGTILSRMSAESNRYAEGKMEKILGGFKELAAYSASIGRDASAIMRDILDAEGRTSLGGVARESGRISSDLDAFFGETDSLRRLADELTAASAEQLSKIRKMAEGIEGFSETIRLISMNVNIEAARLSSSSSASDARNSGKGFQVLARNMSEFALKAQELAQNERLTIDQAEGALAEVNARFAAKLRDLVSRIPEIRSRLDPFEGVIKAAFGHLEGLVRTLGGLSGEVDARLKAIIGQLQFQDLSRQELEHIIGFLAAGLSLESEFGAQAFALRSLSADQEAALRKRAMEIYRGLATTINELRVIESYSSEKGIELPAEGSEAAAGEEALGDGSIRMF